MKFIKKRKTDWTIGKKKTKFDHILYREMARQCNDIIRQYVFL